MRLPLLIYPFIIMKFVKVDFMVLVDICLYL